MKYQYRPQVIFRDFFKRWIGIQFSSWFVNFIFQKIFRLNSEVPFQVNFTSTVTAGKKIILGKNVWKSFALSGCCYIQGGNGINIGDDTIFAPGVKIISANHDPKDLHRWLPASPIHIGKRCWIGANAVILPGVELGDDVIVAAGAVVNKSFPANSIVGGVPAKLLKKYYPK